MEQLDTTTIRAAEPGALDLAETVLALCEALDAARVQIREQARTLERHEGDLRGTQARLEIAQRARAVAEVERGRFQLVLNTVRVECHRVLTDVEAGPERREVVRDILAALDGRA